MSNSLLLLEPPRLRNVADVFTVSAFAHYSVVWICRELVVLRRRGICLLLVATSNESVHRQFIPEAVHLGRIDFPHPGCSLEDLVVDKPLLLYDTLVILYLLLLPLHDVFEILLLCVEVGFLGRCLATGFTHVVPLAGRALRV